jgi:hypothetical protein
MPVQTQQRHRSELSFFSASPHKVVPYSSLFIFLSVPISFWLRNKTLRVSSMVAGHLTRFSSKVVTLYKVRQTFWSCNSHACMVTAAPRCRRCLHSLQLEVLALEESRRFADFAPCRMRICCIYGVKFILYLLLNNLNNSFPIPVASSWKHSALKDVMPRVQVSDTKPFRQSAVCQLFFFPASRCMLLDNMMSIINQQAGIHPRPSPLAGLFQVFQRDSFGRSLPGHRHPALGPGSLHWPLNSCPEAFLSLKLTRQLT